MWGPQQEALKLGSGGEKELELAELSLKRPEQWAVDCGSWAVGRGLWAVGSGPWAAGRRPWAVGSGQANEESRGVGREP